MRNDVKEVLKWQEEMVARMEQLSPRESESVMNEFRRFIEMSVTKLSAITQWIVEVVHFENYANFCLLLEQLKNFE